MLREGPELGEEVSGPALVGAAGVHWQGWTMQQGRSLVHTLFSAITLGHTDGLNGARADPTRIHCTWRAQ